MVVDREVSADGVTVVQVDDVWRVTAAIAVAFHGHPSKDLKVLGITGTSGKTSVSYFCESILAQADLSTGRFGTIDYRIGKRLQPAFQTTPEAPFLQSLLREAVDEGVEVIVMEVSSHALALGRVDGIDFDVAAFTNLSQDHLNFHRDIDEYRDAKGLLFSRLKNGAEGGTAVINFDDPNASVIASGSEAHVLSYGIEQAADVHARSIRSDAKGTYFIADSPIGAMDIHLRHPGRYNVYNALAAIGAAIPLGIGEGAIQVGLASAPTIPGRFEVIDRGQSFGVVVDYAHKPDALQRILESAAELKENRVLTVFGCGGDRDKQKRPLMGEIAAQGSNVVIVTSDNPRSEDPSRIIEEIVAGMPSTSQGQYDLFCEVDRRKAIIAAIEMAAEGDLILIVGKGHEDYQIVGDKKFDFDDRKEAIAALERVGFGRPKD